VTSRRPPTAARLLGGRYELLSLLATGGMGQVWRGRDVVLQRPVAVKVLRSEYAGDATFLARFRAEAQHTAALAHRNIAALFDYGETSADDGEQLAYLVMELVEGESLAQLLAREGRLGADRTLQVLRQAAAGLAAAHAAGLVHRDVKPGNVLVASDGTVKLTDFGIAWSAASAPLTRTGQVVGTAHYLAPEQAAGSKAGPASDVYALGMIGYECLAGHRAFDGENSVQIALRHLREVPPPLPADVPENVRTLVDRALLKDPADRFADGAAFRDAVDDVLAGRALPPLPAGPRTQPLPAHTAAPRPARRRLVAPLVALLIGAVLGVAALQVWADPPADPGAGTTEEPQSVVLRAGDYVGRPVAEVEAELAAAGLGVELVGQETSTAPAGSVLGVSPVGTVPVGAVIEVAYAVAPPEPQPAPEPAPVAPEPAVEAPAGNDGNDGDDDEGTDDEGTDDEGTDDGNGADEGDDPEDAPGNGNGNGNGNGGANGNGNGNGGANGNGRGRGAAGG
jgi:uncharacterized membrane protein YgcG